jgi:hypothetical protein
MELRGQPRGPAITDDEAGRLLGAVLDGGINLIDTSVDYGHSEELIGRYLGHRRDEYFLASKCGCPLSPPPDATPPYQHDYSPGNVRADIEESLRRLRTDRLDLVQVHMSPSRALMQAEHTVETPCPARSSARPAPTTCAPTWPWPRRDRSRPICTPRPSAACSQHSRSTPGSGRPALRSCLGRHDRATSGGWPG